MVTPQYKQENYVEIHKLSFKMNEKQLFDTIQAGDVSDLYREVTDAALYLATAGFLEDANQVLTFLWQQGLPHDRNTWFADLSFEVLWHVKGKRPYFVPFKAIPLDTIEKNYRNYIGGDRYAYDMPIVAWQDLAGKDAYRQAQTWFLNPKNDKNTLFLLENALENARNLAGYEFATATVMAAEIAAKEGNKDLAIKMCMLWAEKYPEFYLNYNFSLMAQSRHVAPFLLRGCLANALKLDKQKSEMLTQKIIEAIEKRIAFGRSLIYGDLTWKKLLQKLCVLTMTSDPEFFSDEEKKTRWLGYSKASSKAILATEKRLKVRLPNDYKAFLAVTNGFATFSNISPPLLPIEKIDLYKKLEDNVLYNIVKNYLDIENVDKKASIEPFTERAILISQIPHEDIIWLIPPDKDSVDWQTWSFSAKNPGEIRYQSFRHYIEYWVSFFETL
jgi:SMI1 / KNR4 family (SUKH-1)